MMVLYLMNKISNMRQGINEDNQVAKINPEILESMIMLTIHVNSLFISFTITYGLTQNNNHGFF